MSSVFRINTKWLGSAASADPLEVTDAFVEIIVGDNVVTRVLDDDARTTRDALIVSAYPIARWLLLNWWRLRFEPPESPGPSIDWRLTHDMPAIGHGYIWPPISISGDGERVTVRNIDRMRGGPSVSPVHFLTDSINMSVDVDSFSRAVWSFVEHVLARLTALDLRTELHDLYDIVTKEVGDPEVTQKRIFEALLGHDADEANPADIEYVERASGSIGLSAMKELAVAIRGESIPEALNGLNHAIELSRINARVENKGKMRAQYLERAATCTFPYQRGYMAASIAREGLALAPGSVSTGMLADRIGLIANEIVSTRARPANVIGLGVRQGNESMRLVLRSSKEEDRRFELVRLLGDYTFTSGDDQWCPVTKIKTSRQAFQRAFAAELLCPINELRELFAGISSVESEEDLSEAADIFEVNPLVVAYQLKNDGVRVRDALLA